METIGEVRARNGTRAGGRFSELPSPWSHVYGAPTTRAQQTSAPRASAKKNLVV